jgi:phospholipid/cholesterol/gamma-HCH transport system substrate-binding protein
MPELGNNLSIVLNHLHDRDFAVEKDPRSPGGKGYTGFEALLQYVFDQTMAINAFDSNGYMLKVNLFLSECSDYQNVNSLKEKLKEDPAFYQRCAAILGPNQPGITQADPSFTGAHKGAEHHLPAHKKEQKAEAPKAPAKPEDPQRQKPTEEAKKRAEELAERIEETLGIELPELPAGPQVPALPIPLPTLPGQQQPPADTQELLDFLLAP